MSFGLLIKLALAFIIISYLYKKVGKFFFNIFAKQQAESKTSRNNSKGKKAAFVSKTKSDRHSKQFTAGDYVKYEEVD